MNVQVSTSEYQFSHNKMPRGFGNWAFFFGDEQEPVFFNSCTYSEAKKKAVAQAKKYGYRRVKVGA